MLSDLTNTVTQRALFLDLMECSIAQHFQCALYSWAMRYSSIEVLHSQTSCLRWHPTQVRTGPSIELVANYTGHIPTTTDPTA